MDYPEHWAGEGYLNWTGHAVATKGLACHDVDGQVLWVAMAHGAMNSCVHDGHVLRLHAYIYGSVSIDWSLVSGA